VVGWQVCGVGGGECAGWNRKGGQVQGGKTSEVCARTEVGGLCADVHAVEGGNVGRLKRPQPPNAPVRVQSVAAR
jgi:hypothetical protein